MDVNAAPVESKQVLQLNRAEFFMTDVQACFASLRLDPKSTWILNRLSNLLADQVPMMYKNSNGPEALVSSQRINGAVAKRIVEDEIPAVWADLVLEPKIAPSSIISLSEASSTEGNGIPWAHLRAVIVLWHRRVEANGKHTLSYVSELVRDQFGDVTPPCTSHELALTPPKRFVAMVVRQLKEATQHYHETVFNVEDSKWHGRGMTLEQLLEQLCSVTDTAAAKRWGEEVVKSVAMQMSYRDGGLLDFLDDYVSTFEKHENEWTREFSDDEEESNAVFL